MKRSPMKRGTSTLKRSAMKRTVTRKKKIPGYHNTSYLDACRGESCYLQVPGVCLGAAGKDTVVPAHSNQGRHGSGMSIKSRDVFSVPGCMTCHRWIDQNTTGASRAAKFAIWDNAYSRWRPVRDEKMSQKNNPATVCAVPGFHSQIY